MHFHAVSCLCCLQRVQPRILCVFGRTFHWLADFFPFGRRLPQINGYATSFDMVILWSCCGFLTLLGFGAQSLPHLVMIYCQARSTTCYKHAVVPVPLDQESEGYYSTYYIVSTQEGHRASAHFEPQVLQSITKKGFKMDTLNSIVSVMILGQWMVSLDLKDVYFHVPILRHHKYLRFCWLG